MKIRLLVFLFGFLVLVDVGRAEYATDALLAKAARDPKNAPALIAIAAKDNPKSLVKIVSASVTAFPEQAAAIVTALLTVAPKHAAEIIKAAVIAAPTFAVEIATAGVDTLPGSANLILKAAAEAAPEDLQEAVNSITVNSAEKAYATPDTQRPPAFPDQPIRPDVVVSPSS